MPGRAAAAIRGNRGLGAAASGVRAGRLKIPMLVQKAMRSAARIPQRAGGFKGRGVVLDVPGRRRRLGGGRSRTQKQENAGQQEKRPAA